jgi:putative ABC transport system ATP-binding protein
MAKQKTSPVISARHLTRIYRLGDSEVIGVKDIVLDILPGELVVLKGDSGSGKSTLLSLIAGLDHPTRGYLNVADHDLTKSTPSDLTCFRREVVGMVFQSFNLLPTLNVVENACLPGLLAGKSLDRVSAKAMELIEWLGLSTRWNHLPAQLSGGEMQRTAIARALINDPDIILADEPTGNLDSRNGQIVMELFAELNRKWNRTVIIATHSDIADSLASMTLCLKDGEITDHTCDL